MSEHLHSKPLVSIGMPVYNGERYIRQALDSLLAQDFENFELIISDNASTDRTQEICLEYAARDRRVRYYRNETNMGMIWNYNQVFELSSGEYFMWAAHDDYWEPCYLHSCLDAFDTSEAIILAGALCEGVDSETGKPICTFPGLSTTGLSPCARFMRVGSAHARIIGPYGLFYGVYKRSALHEALPFRKALAADYLLLAGLSLKGEFVTVPEKLMVRRVRQHSRSSQAIARALGISWLQVWCRCEVLEIMLLRLILQSYRLTLRERIMLVCWSLGKYVQFSVYHGALPLLTYRTLLALCPNMSTRARQLWWLIATN